jgi:beta-N-acetylhexosaminidase
MDDELPASLSPKVNKILREDLKFSGLIMTDDLEMGAIKNFSDNSATQAVIAGNDLIISSNFKEEKKQVIDAVNAGTISEEQINTAVKRILACKLLYEIIK